jgi:hypothetical protein
MKTKKREQRRKKSLNRSRKNKIYYGGEDPITSIDGIPDEIFNEFVMRFSSFYSEKRPAPFKMQLKSALTEINIDNEKAAALTDEFINAMKFNKSLKEASSKPAIVAESLPTASASASVDLIKSVEGVPEDLFSIIQNKFEGLLTTNKPYDKPPNKMYINQIRDTILTETGVNLPKDQDYDNAALKATEILKALLENKKRLESSPSAIASVTAIAAPSPPAVQLKEVIDPEIMQTIQNMYKVNTNKRAIERKLVTFAGENKILASMIPVYLAALQEKKEIDITQPKFKKLYEIWSCNRGCLTNSIPILSKGLDMTEEEYSKFENDIQNTKQLEKLYPEIEDSCGPKSKTSASSSSSVSKSSSTNDETNYATMSYESLENALKKVNLELALEESNKSRLGSTDKKSYSGALNNYMQLASMAGYSFKTISDSLKRNSPLPSKNKLNLSAAFQELINIKKRENQSKINIKTLVEKLPEITKYLYIKYIEYYRNEYNKVIDLLNKKEPLSQNEQLAVEKADTYIAELNEALDPKAFFKLIVDIENEAKRNASNERKTRERAEKAAAEAKIKEELKKSREAEKVRFITEFKERNKNNKEGLEFLDKITKAKIITSALYPDFVRAFPNESPEDFWKFYVEKPLNKPSPDQVKRVPKPKFVPPLLQPNPSEEDLELNKRLFNFDLKNNQFFDKNKPVDVYGRSVPLATGGKKSRRRKNKNTKVRRFSRRYKF